MSNQYEQLVRQVESDDRLSRVLSFALRLSRGLEDSDLSSWIERELFGYVNSNPSMTDEIIVPEYRTVSGQWYDAFGRRFVVTQPELVFINETRLRHGVAELEQLATVQGELALPDPTAAEIIKRYLQVEVYWLRFSPAAIPPILGSIRSQLLQYLIRNQSQLERIRTPQAATSKEDIIEIRPNLYGIGIDVRALWRRWRSTSGER